jgi:hypothetical protein
LAAVNTGYFDFATGDPTLIAGGKPVVISTKHQRVLGHHE